MSVYSCHFVDMFTAGKGGRRVALWLWLCLCLARGAAQVPCSVTHSLGPGEGRVFRFQRAGEPGALLCSFVFQAPLGSPIAVGLLDFASESEQPDCNCGALRMYDLTWSGELQLSVTKCAGESAGGVALHASSNVALVTLSSDGCPAPSFSLVVGAPEYVDGALSPAPANASGIESATNGPVLGTRNGTDQNTAGMGEGNSEGTDTNIGENSTEVDVRISGEEVGERTNGVNFTPSSPTETKPATTASPTVTTLPSAAERRTTKKGSFSTKATNGSTSTTTKKP